jgi:hypothetical protein
MPIGSPNLDLYSILGAQYFNDGLSITHKVPVFGFQHSASANKDWLDPIVGLTGATESMTSGLSTPKETSAGLNERNGAGCSLPFRSALLISCLRAGIWSRAQVFIAGH